MKHKYILLLLVVLAVTAGYSVSQAKPPRKLPVSAYLKSAKIEIISGDLERYKSALYLLDSLFLYYGHHAEGLSLRTQVYVDFIDKESDPAKKRAPLELLVAYVDSLRACCENKDIKKKYRKNCKKFVTKADSTKIKFWREFYNAGVEQLTSVEEAAKELESETDSMSIDYLRETLDANIDSCMKNLELAILIDPEDHRPYIGAAQAYEKKKDYVRAIDLLEQGLERTTDRQELMLPIAYNYINAEEYCDAIPYFKEFVANAEPDNSSALSTMGNLVICYNNCKQFEEAFQVNLAILERDSANTRAMSNIVRYYNQQARDASDSAGFYRKQSDDKSATMWQKNRDESFDSSIVFSRKVFDLKPDDARAAEDYALGTAIRGRYEDAVEAFSRLTQLEPDGVDNWTSLGDCQLYLKKWDKAIIAYVKVVEIEPDNGDIWLRLKDLYHQVRDSDKEAKAQKQLDRLK